MRMNGKNLLHMLPSMSREKDCVKIDDYCFFNGTKSIHVIHSPEELYIISFLVVGWLTDVY